MPRAGTKRHVPAPRLARHDAGTAKRHGTKRAKRHDAA
jgi:hypothetical protein